MHPYLTSLQRHRHHSSWSSMEDDENADEECLSHTTGCTSDGDSGIYSFELDLQKQILKTWKTDSTQ